MMDPVNGIESYAGPHTKSVPRVDQYALALKLKSTVLDSFPVIVISCS